ncbi:MAG: ABC transporter ATP-binding protein [Caldilineaceae bacterium]|nr:ABC transporter ATP-binding protein [Caldilineaceae bacterium]
MHVRRKKFFSYYRPYTGVLLADLFCAVMVSVALLLIPLCARSVTKTVLAGVTADTISQIYAMGLVMLGLVALHAACHFFVDYQGHMMGAKMERDMRDELFAHYQTLSFGFFDEQKTGQLMTRLTHDTFNMSELYHHGPEDIVISLLNFVGAFIIMLTIDRDLALIIFAFLPVMTVYAVYFNRKMRRAMRLCRDRIGIMNAQVEDSLNGIRVVKSFGNEPLEQRKFAYENEAFLESRRRDYLSEAYFYEGMQTFMQLMPIAVIVFGAAAISRTSLDPADMIAFLLYVAILTEPIQRFSNFTRLYQEGITGFERFMEMLEVQPGIRNAPNALVPSAARGAIRLCDVTFRYQANGPAVLRNVSLDIAPGEYVALVGASGVGKSTLCALIPRFYDVTDGCVLFDGVDVRCLDVHALRRGIGVVQQEVYLFAGTVAENIAYGRPDAPRDAIIAAARRANAHDFIMALPDGYATEIGQRGIKLSGGQRQRLSIARVFLKNPPVLILDEATSALDNHSERKVQQSLEDLAQGRTTIVIAHRLETVRNARRIVVLDAEGIVEEGTFAELLAKNGAFARLYATEARI